MSEQLELDLGITPINIAPEEPEPTEEELDSMIPRPVGYRVLIVMPEIEETFGESGILKAGKTIQHDSILSMVGLVLELGEQAYADKERFPTGPWCKQGDYVMFRANSGTRFKVGRNEYRLLNDDTVEAVVQNPSAIQRVN